MQRLGIAVEGAADESDNGVTGTAPTTTDAGSAVKVVGVAVVGDRFWSPEAPVATDATIAKEAVAAVVSEAGWEPVGAVTAKVSAIIKPSYFGVAVADGLAKVRPIKYAPVKDYPPVVVTQAKF